jgi:hypothetical protein
VEQRMGLLKVEKFRSPREPAAQLETPETFLFHREHQERVVLLVESF